MEAPTSHTEMEGAHMPARDIVSETGTFYTGLGALPVVKTTTTSAWIDLATFDGCEVYILANTYSDGTLTPTIHVSDDGSTDLGTAAAADLVTWQATSSSNYTPVKATDAGGAVTGHIQPSAITNAATAINQRVGYLGNHRYVSVTTTVTGSPSTGCGYDVIIVAGRPRLMPSNV
jgi:hypothetical protein